MKIKITHHGWPAHFICAGDCNYFRHTRITVDGNKYYIVSTVGMMRARHKEDAAGRRVYDTIGYNRHYETMCFKGKEKNGYIEIDVTTDFYPDAERTIEYSHCDNEADRMHDDMVQEVVRMIEAGEV